MGPYPSHLQLKRMMANFREGSGEGYVFDFVVNIYWLRFLKLTNQLSDKTLNDGLNKLVTSKYHVIILYRHRFHSILLISSVL